MNRTKLGTTLGIISLLAITTIAAQAQHGGGRGGRSGGNSGGLQTLAAIALPPGIAQPLFSPKILAALDLTSDQKTTIAGLLTTYATTVKPYQTEIAADETSAKALYEATTYDSSSATTLAEDEATQVGDIILAAQAVQADIYTNVLTSTQQAAYVTAVASSSSSSSSSSSDNTSTSSSSSSNTPTLPTLAAIILRESTALALTTDETTALQSIESAQITAETTNIATVKSDLTAYTSAYNASTYDEDALTSAVNTAEGDLATLLETDWSAQSAAFLTLTTDQQATFLDTKPSGGHGGNGGYNGNGNGNGSGSGSTGSSSSTGSNSSSSSGTSNGAARGRNDNIRI